MPLLQRVMREGPPSPFPHLPNRFRHRQLQEKNPTNPDHIPENELKYSDKSDSGCFA
jgi:hypothetical protein